MGTIALLAVLFLIHKSNIFNKTLIIMIQLMNIITNQLMNNDLSRMKSITAQQLNIGLSLQLLLYWHIYIRKY